MVRGIVCSVGILVLALGVGCGGDTSNAGDVIGDTTPVPDKTCLPGIPCVRDADCPNGHHCNTAANPPVCQKLYCGGLQSACSEDELCQSQQCDEEKCAPDCSGLECGPDPVYGASCGTCSGGSTCESGECVCTPQDHKACCGGNVCWIDSCGGSGAVVASCPTGCADGKCKDCTANCSGKNCGDDGCGGSCGQCDEGETCKAGHCETCSGSCSGEMVTVSGGSFWQGCNEAVDTDCYNSEKPYHEVSVPAFEIDRFEVTVGLYGDCVTGGGCTAPKDTTYSSYCNWGVSGKEDHPVNCITWYQAGEYCSWAGKRLCSESEWEKASRGTDGRKYPWGNETATCQYAVMYEGGYGCNTGGTMAVGSKPAGASPYGAQDMSGNVWEWVEDDWHSEYTGAPTNGSAWVEDPRASTRVTRGGSFAYTGYYLRSSNRLDYYYPAYVNYSFGARCCRSK